MRSSPTTRTSLISRPAPMGETHLVPGERRDSPDRLAGGDLRPSAESLIARSEHPESGRSVAGSWLPRRVGGNAAAIRILVRGGPRGRRLSNPLPLLLRPARSYRDARLAGRDCRPARHEGPDRNVCTGVQEGPALGQHRVPDHHGWPTSCPPIRGRIRCRWRPGPPS